jgi:hypothetical protein
MKKFKKIKKDFWVYCEVAFNLFLLILTLTSGSTYYAIAAALLLTLSVKFYRNKLFEYENVTVLFFGTEFFVALCAAFHCQAASISQKVWTIIACLSLLIIIVETIKEWIDSYESNAVADREENADVYQAATRLQDVFVFSEGQHDQTVRQRAEQWSQRLAKAQNPLFLSGDLKVHKFYYEPGETPEEYESRVKTKIKALLQERLSQLKQGETSEDIIDKYFYNQI